MTALEYNLTQIIYFGDELGDDIAFLNWLKHIKQEMPALTVVPFDNMFQIDYSNYEILSRTSILITGRNNAINIANSYNIANFGYLPELDKFLPCAYVIQGFDEIDFDYINKIFKRYHHIPLTIAITKRCIIKELSLEDLDALYDLYSKPQITQFIEPLFSHDDELEYQKNYIKYMYEYYGYGMWLVFDKQTNSLIGRAGLDHCSFFTNDEDEPEIEMGYLIATEYQRLGYATEVCLAIIDFARNNLSTDVLHCLVHPDNRASGALLNKLGFEDCGFVNTSASKLQHYIYKLHQ